MTVTVQVENFEAFFEAPLQAYGANTPYVSPLKADLARFLSIKDNPLFRDDSALTYFTAHRDGRIVGRITAHLHGESNRLHDCNRGYFGYFDVADDSDAAVALLNAAESWCRARGLSEIAGNFNLTAMQQIGVLTDGFEEAPFTDQVWSPPHVARLLAAHGYAATFPMATFRTDLRTTPPPALGPKQQAIAGDHDFTFAPVTRRLVDQRMEEARQILNASFAENPMFVPVTAEEFHFQAKDMKWVMDPRISAVLHHRGQPAAAIICVPDLNPLLKAMRSRIGLTTPVHYLRHRMTCRQAVLIFSGVVPHLQGQGIGPYVLRHVAQAAKAAGYHHIANTWIADVNAASLAQKEKAGGILQHRLHLFGKSL
ncbi:GNAT family N-acetyltransferase [Actibacterium sp. 188UL27-1]|uniref:GNAT family N-acetyltransferase n=1 Tax=Actibacterium sp. 188UL27-1 TaxID=2786961 RepID=UPI0019593B6B|nr:GNAT family N-acetyltransferase [Actibacterium sp. 188UL27-1]MBM7067365.1 GNAT family N-acetyltransferase [Actibacterium sp. 188UL27-1]